MLDIIGDIHGHYSSLKNLLLKLGYEESKNYSHPEGRKLVFLGDLVDYGEQSLQVLKLVCNLIENQQATAIMGNHEYNLLEAVFDIQAPRPSGEKVYEEVKKNPEVWESLLEQVATWPLAIETKHLRLVHSCWHEKSLNLIAPILHRNADHPKSPSLENLVCWFDSPFKNQKLRENLPNIEIPFSNDRPHAIIMKGLEEMAETPYLDTHGIERNRLRVKWWLPNVPDTPKDKVSILGHYRHLPPVEGEFAPPFSYGLEDHKRWAKELVSKIPDCGNVVVPNNINAICIDFDGMRVLGRLPSVGAYRWPEQEVHWASSQ